MKEWLLDSPAFILKTNCYLTLSCKRSRSIKMTMLLLLSLIPLIFCSNAEEDPCSSRVYMIDDRGRSTSCSLNYDECDRYIKEQWYQVITTEDGDLNMPTTCIDSYNCGTVYPIWMNGTLPSVEDGVVDRTACVTVWDNCCHHSYNIQVKNCGRFYVYYLVRCLGCPERYCFGNSSNCPTTPIPTTSTTQKTSVTHAWTSGTTGKGVSKPTSTETTPNAGNDSLCPSSFAFMTLAACLLGTTVGLAVNIFLRARRDRRVEDGEKSSVYPSVYKNT